MKKIFTLRHVKIASYIISVLFMAIHMMMLYIFWKQDATFLIYFNIFSILFYVIMLFVIKNGKIFAFTIATFIEVSVHMALILYYTGWSGGFQITLIGISIILAFAEYVANSLKLKYFRSVYLLPIPMIVYIGSYIVNLYHTPEYSLSEGVNTFFEITWAVIVFVIVGIILQIFVYVTTQAEKELSSEVMHDELTGIPNRFYMHDYFKKLTDETDKNKYWVAITDIDDFKTVNDTYGHNCGDYVLKTVAQEMKKLLPETELCRWGGEEFVIVGNSEKTDMYEALEHYRKAISEYQFEYENQIIHITVTVGCAWLREDLNLSSCLSIADQNLYRGKTTGKNKVCY